MKKILTLLFVLLLACGCSSQQPAQDAQEGTSVLRIGMECDYAPFNWTQSSDSDTAVPTGIP